MSIYVYLCISLCLPLFMPPPWLTHPDRYYAQDIRRWLKKTFSGGDESDIYHDLDDESESPAERERESDSSYHALIDETPNRI